MNRIVILSVLIAVATVAFVILLEFDQSQVSGKYDYVANEEGLVENLPLVPLDSQINLTLTELKFNPTNQFIDEQWAIKSMGLPFLWSITMGSSDIVVAVLDTGIDKDHEDLSGQVIGEVNFTESSTADDIYGHGTHIAGIIAAKNNDIGILGIAPGVKLLNVKVADDRGRCNASDLAKGIIWAVDNGADIINISIEIKDPSPDLEEPIEYAWSHGVLIIAAAGNNGGQYPVYPAYYDNCIAVAAIKEDNSLAPLSNHGDWVTLAAPGFDIYSTLPNDGYGFESGTSFANAYVSGIAALLFGVVNDDNDNGKLNDEVLALIESSCQNIGITGVGQGKIDATMISTLVNLSS